MNLRKYFLFLFLIIGSLSVKAQWLGGTSGTGTNIKLILAANTCNLTYDSSVIFYHGGNYGNYGTNSLNNNTCPFILDTASSFYHGGNYGGYMTNNILPSVCGINIDSSVIFYRGGNYGSYANTLISASGCNYSLDSSVIFYRGGNYGTYATDLISATACPIPQPTNIFMGGLSSTSAPGNLVNLTSNNTSGPFMTSINDPSITNGNCVTLTTTGSGATSYSWLPTTGLSNASILSPIANPTTTTTYTLTATGTGPGCRAVYAVTVNVLAGNESGTSFRYPSSTISTSVTSPQSVILTGITGGAFSVTSANLKINTVTGDITPNTSTAGTYTVNYTYGSCSNTVSTSVLITTNTTNNGEVNYPNFYLGATSASTPKLFNNQSACIAPMDYTLMIYSGGTTGAAAAKQILTTAACINNIDYSVSFYVGGTSAITQNKFLTQGACTPYINPSNTIFMGGTSAGLARLKLDNAYCNYPVGDNFYLGGSGVGYGISALTPTTGANAGTTVVTLADVSICPSGTVTLTTTGATSYTWQPATGLSNSLIASPIASPISTTTYTVVGLGGVGCVNKATVTVTVLTDTVTQISYGGNRFNETELSVKKVNYLAGPLTGTFSVIPATGLNIDLPTGSFIPGYSSSGSYTINYSYVKSGCNYVKPVSIIISTVPPAITYPNPSTFYLNYGNTTASPINSGGVAYGYKLIDSLPTGLTINLVSGVISGTPTAIRATSKFRVLAYNYNKSGDKNYSDTATINLEVRKPVISSSTTSIAGLTGTYGNVSTASTLNVSGTYIIQNVIVTPPSSFEVSTNASSGFANTVSLAQSGGSLTNTNVYIRLKSNAPVGSYSGTVNLTSYAADTISISMATNTVSAAPLTVTAAYFQKFYGSTLVLGTGNTNFTSSGLANSETIGSVTLTAAGGTGADDAPGLYDITPTAATGGTFSETNYIISYVPGQFEVMYSLYNFNMNGNTSNWVQGKVPISKINAGVISNITSTGATYDAKVSTAYSKLTRKGICYSTNINPDINTNVIDDGIKATGTMSINITGLNTGTPYYVRTFVTIGNYTYYGPNVKFTTKL